MYPSHSSNSNNSRNESIKQMALEPIVTVDRSSGPGLSPILKKKFNFQRRSSLPNSRLRSRSVSMGTKSSSMEIGNTADPESSGGDIIMYPRRSWSHRKLGPKIKKKKKSCYADKSVQTLSESSKESSISNIESFWERRYD